MDEADFQILLDELKRVYAQVDELTRQGKFTDVQKVSVISRLEAIQKLLSDPEPPWGIIGLLIKRVMIVGGGLVALTAFVDAIDSNLERIGQKPLHEQVQELVIEYNDAADASQEWPAEGQVQTVYGTVLADVERNGAAGRFEREDGTEVTFIKRVEEETDWQGADEKLFLWTVTREDGVIYCTRRALVSTD